MLMKLVLDRVEGMPAPKPDGSLSHKGTGAWEKVDESMLPFIHVGCPIHHADALVRNAPDGVVSAAVKKRILCEFQATTATIVVVAPEVCCWLCKSLCPRIQQYSRQYSNKAACGHSSMWSHASCAFFFLCVCCGSQPSPWTV